MIFPHIQELTMKILVQMRGLLCGQRRIWHLRTDKTEKQSACAQRETVEQVHARTTHAYGVE
jgi:hypothetical protein